MGILHVQVGLQDVQDTLGVKAVLPHHGCVSPTGCKSVGPGSSEW